jgi:hypothetical protein
LHRLPRTCALYEVRRRRQGRHSSPSSNRQVHLDQTPLTGTDLSSFTKDLASRLGVIKALDPRNIRVNSHQINEDRAKQPLDQPTFLNSYITDDLALVSTALVRGDAGTALAMYLTANRGVPRIDVRINALVVRDLCSPSAFRWADGSPAPNARWRSVSSSR